MRTKIYELFMMFIYGIGEVFLLWFGIQLALLGSLGLIFIPNWAALIALFMLLIGIFLIIRFFKLIKKTTISSQQK